MIKIIDESIDQTSCDSFVLKCLRGKRYGTFVEVGATHPWYENRSYLLETVFHWRGIVIDHDPRWRLAYEQLRGRTHHVTAVAAVAEIDWVAEFATANLPVEIDYLHISSGGEILHSEIMKKYRFAVVTANIILEESLLENHGYVCVEGSGWIHPELIEL
jgi:hypothetical protein